MSDIPANFMGRIDIKALIANRPKVPLAELAPHFGRFIAWKGDGTGIAASGVTREDLDQELHRVGLECDQVVFDYLEDPSEGGPG